MTDTLSNTNANSYSSYEKINYKLNFFNALENLNESEEKGIWAWIDCNYFLKYSPDKKNVSYLNMTPFYQITKFSECITYTKLIKPEVEINLEKNLIFDTNLGWNWHKSWILPAITVKINNLSELGLDDSQVFLKLFVVKAGLQETETFYLVDIGSLGEDKSFFKNSTAVINNLKFSSTSYNNEGLKFHIVLIIFYEKNGLSDFSCTSNLKILDSKLSPPIYVDSRKSARENLGVECKNFDWFSPDMLIKTLFKRRKKNGEICEEVITNSYKGFLGYYTAANIRNKIKNPFFPALRFSNCISLFYNKELFKGMSLDQIIENLIFMLIKYNDSQNLNTTSKKKKGKIKLILNHINDNAYLTFLIQNNKDINNSKKVSEFLTSFDNRVINIISNASPRLYEFFVQIEDLNMLLKTYKELYEKHSLFNDESENSMEKKLEYSQSDIENEESNSDSKNFAESNFPSKEHTKKKGLSSCINIRNNAQNEEKLGRKRNLVENEKTMENLEKKIKIEAPKINNNNIIQPLKTAINTNGNIQKEAEEKKDNDKNSPLVKNEKKEANNLNTINNINSESNELNNLKMETKNNANNANINNSDILMNQYLANMNFQNNTNNLMIDPNQLGMNMNMNNLLAYQASQNLMNNNLQNLQNLQNMRNYIPFNSNFINANGNTNGKNQLYQMMNQNLMNGMNNNPYMLGNLNLVQQNLNNMNNNMVNLNLNQMQAAAKAKYLNDLMLMNKMG